MHKSLILMLATTLVAGAAAAQTSPSHDPANNAAANANAAVMAPKTEAQTGEKTQPQGPTGPINTTSGGTPPSSPQGDSPPGMQPNPQDPQQAATTTPKKDKAKN